MAGRKTHSRDALKKLWVIQKLKGVTMPRIQSAAKRCAPEVNRERQNQAGAGRMVAFATTGAQKIVRLQKSTDVMCFTVCEV
jgi:hypothetical protein